MSTSVCLSFCLSIRISPEAHVQSLTFFVHIAYGRGSVLLRRCCDMLCTSSFVDDVFSIMGVYYSCINFATKDRFRLNLLLYHKVGKNLISY